MQIAQNLWRIRAENPSPMTDSGTNSYVLHGPEGAVVIDPGPALPAHLSALRATVGAAPLRAILLTHPHLDHSALVAELKAQTGAVVYGFGTAQAGRSAVMRRLAQRCQDEGLARLEWSVLDWNAPSIAFYDSLGASAQTEWIVRRLTDGPLKALAEG